MNGKMFSWSDWVSQAISCQTFSDWHAGKYHSLIVYVLCFSICALFLCRLKHQFGIRMYEMQYYSVVYLKHLPGWSFMKCVLSQLWWVGNNLVR